ncbi:MAG: hypothetical protein DBX59_11435 [Bacillota bacterium]|nr:MAG: hypothetical protein DBX59_11435 [Bacillota bacterium]
MAVSTDFQNRIIDLVAEADKKKSDLPKTIGIDYRSFSNAYNYGIIPKPRILIKIADYFNVSLKYLLGKTNDDYFIKSEIPVDFKTRFLELCQERGVSHYSVSKDCHFDRSYITKWLNYGLFPSLELLELMADYFNVSLDFITGRSKD